MRTLESTTREGRWGQKFRLEFEEAVTTLNTLQSNASVLAQCKEERDRKRFQQLPDTVSMCERAGIKLADIDKLGIIHISGTKGKGSTSAFCESILRAHGYKTGFFSSPHLVEVRERIRINGRPLSKDLFSTYFWDCYKRLDSTKELYNGEMPPYFRFLTIMAFHVFLQEQVDVAIMEVGIGGEYDSTNIVSNPIVCGVTSLGLDHTSILGDTLDQIAWHKAGIFKPGVPAVSVDQPENTIEVLKERAKEKGCPLYLAPRFDEYKLNKEVTLGIAGTVQKKNASLALQLCNIFLENHKLGADERRELYSSYLSKESDVEYFYQGKSFEVPPTMVTGLESCSWPGRSQTIKKPGITYYIDGAHTTRSIACCSEWFTTAAEKEAQELGGKVVRILIFNTTGDRQAEHLLEPVLGCNIDAAVFCPNIPKYDADADTLNLNVTKDAQLYKCIKNRNAWLKLVTSSRNGTFTPSSHNTMTPSTSGISTPTQSEPSVASSSCDSPAKKRPKQSESSVTPSVSEDSGIDSVTSSRNSPSHEAQLLCTCDTILDSLYWATHGRDSDLPHSASEGDSATHCPLTENPEVHIQILCTGSLHLVGGLLGLVDSVNYS